jgi:hypothetical protein
MPSMLSHAKTMDLPESASAAMQTVIGLQAYRTKERPGAKCSHFGPISRRGWERRPNAWMHGACQHLRILSFIQTDPLPSFASTGEGCRNKGKEETKPRGPQENHRGHQEALGGGESRRGSQSGQITFTYPFTCSGDRANGSPGEWVAGRIY